MMMMMMMMQVWMLVSGAEQRREERPDLYRKLLDGPQDAQLVELIKIGQ